MHEGIMVRKYDVSSKPISEIYYVYIYIYNKYTEASHHNTLNIYIYIKCIVTNKYSSRLLEYNYTNSQKICT